MPVYCLAVFSNIHPLEAAQHVALMERCIEAIALANVVHRRLQRGYEAFSLGFQCRCKTITTRSEATKSPTRQAEH